MESTYSPAMRVRWMIAYAEGWRWAPSVSDPALTHLRKPDGQGVCDIIWATCSTAAREEIMALNIPDYENDLDAMDRVYRNLNEGPKERYEKALLRVLKLRFPQCRSEFSLALRADAKLRVYVFERIFRHDWERTSTEPFPR